MGVALTTVCPKSPVRPRATLPPHALPVCTQRFCPRFVLNCWLSSSEFIVDRTVNDSRQKPNQSHVLHATGQSFETACGVPRLNVPSQVFTDTSLVHSSKSGTPLHVATVTDVPC